MCIIAIKNSGVEFPNDSTIENMWDNNSDGAGLMWAEDGRVKIQKGFMKYEEFSTFIDQWKKTHDTTATPVVFHFRISTHAGVNPQCTHPFPISDKKEDLMQLNTTTDIGVVHNGIIPITARTGISDTMEYILTQLYYIKRCNRKFYKDDHFKDLIKSAIKSKMAFLTAAGDVYTIGDFNTDSKTGMIYSNYSWSYSRYSSTYYNSKTGTSGSKGSKKNKKDSTNLLAPYSSDYYQGGFCGWGNDEDYDEWDYDWRYPGLYGNLNINNNKTESNNTSTDAQTDHELNDASDISDNKTDVSTTYTSEMDVETKTIFLNELDTDKYMIRGCNLTGYDIYNIDTWILYDKCGRIYVTDDGYHLYHLKCAYASDSQGHLPIFYDDESFGLECCIEHVNM